MDANLNLASMFVLACLGAAMLIASIIILIKEALPKRKKKR